jgi:hypothetical protein
MNAQCTASALDEQGQIAARLGGLDNAEAIGVTRHVDVRRIVARSMSVASSQATAGGEH